VPKKGYKQLAKYTCRLDPNDIIGKDFGRLYCAKYAYKKGYYYYYWCECGCGEWVIVRRSSLKESFTKSCGCLQRERTSEANRGKNNPMYGIIGKNHPSYGKKRPDTSKRMSGEGNPMYGIKRFGKDNFMYGRTGEKHHNYGKTGEESSSYKHGLSYTKPYKSQKQAERRLKKSNQTPESADLEKITYIYKTRDMINQMSNEKYIVDHWQPISKGGLHHEDNLQILEETLNGEKGDKWPLTEEEKIRYTGFRL